MQHATVTHAPACYSAPVLINDLQSTLNHSDCCPEVVLKVHLKPWVISVSLKYGQCEHWSSRKNVNESQMCMCCVWRKHLKTLTEKCHVTCCPQEQCRQRNITVSTTREEIKPLKQWFLNFLSHAGDWSGPSVWNSHPSKASKLENNWWLAFILNKLPNYKYGMCTDTIFYYTHKQYI